MMDNKLYEKKQRPSWNINKIAEVLCLEWGDLGPDLKKDVTIYEKKVTQISFKGEINVALKIMKQRFLEKDTVKLYFNISLSPIPFNPDTHVLNTLDMGVFIDIVPSFENTDCFSIGKDEPWANSQLSEAAKVMRSIIEKMMRFESCFHLLLDDEYDLDGTKLDMRKLTLTHHLNQVKAYRLAEIYHHSEKLDEAVGAIKSYAQENELVRQRIDDLCEKKSAGGMDWLYTTEIIEKLCD